LEKNKHQKWITSDHHHHDQYGKWNKSLQTLTAVESSIINSTMLPQIAILAWVFLGEPLNLRQILGLGLVTIGIVIVQVWRGKRQ
jgi:drug/metabolite transporter (DMT)-like permease